VISEPPVLDEFVLNLIASNGASFGCKSCGMKDSNVHNLISMGKESLALKLEVNRSTCVICAACKKREDGVKKVRYIALQIANVLSSICVYYAIPKTNF
jgi:hypothetical protein